MKTATDAIVILVGLLHFCFLILEMFFWQKPLGLRVFRQSKEKAEASAVLAANQGLYNGFLSVGLMGSFFYANPETTQSFQIFFLFCVVAAGIFGAVTVSRRIFYVQALPALIALVFRYTQT